MIEAHDPIVAPATASGGAIAVIRISGDGALSVCDKVFRGRAPLTNAAGYTVHFGRILDGERVVDESLATVFRAPHSYTGEDSVELSCHGSAYIVSEILRLLLAAGTRMADPGEFTIRAYLAGKLDLSQAEAVADLVASSSRTSHTLAMNQMRGGYSEALDALRDELLTLASLLELELDFSEEEVEFADRERLRTLMKQICERIERLRGSFALGNALKEGVPVAIVGAPNVGKSTLLNRLLNEERAMVSEIAGTTRDVIEAHANIDGVVFRFLDTAGIRATDDKLEQMGIERTMSSIERANIVIYLLDATAPSYAAPALRDNQTPPAAPVDFTLHDGQTLLTVINKIDLAPAFPIPAGAIGLSALSGAGIDALRTALRASVDTSALYHGDTVVSNSRHYEALTAAGEALHAALASLSDDLPADLLSEEVREVIRRIGAITGRGAIASDEILHNIFAKFCIGK